jgi:hypothetical protein
MGRFTQGVKAKWWEAVMEQCEQHEQVGKSFIYRQYIERCNT